jgi:hypothetical protein
MTTDELFAKTGIQSWKLAISRLNQLLSSLSDDDLQREVASERNRVYYIVGHLAATHDRMFPLLRLGERLHPELDVRGVCGATRSSLRTPTEPFRMKSLAKNCGRSLRR